MLKKSSIYRSLGLVNNPKTPKTSLRINGVLWGKECHGLSPYSIKVYGVVVVKRLLLPLELTTLPLELNMLWK